MASVRKRKWTSGGEVKTAWVADYFDQHDKRHIETFDTKAAAQERLDQIKGEVNDGTHTADSDSKTIADAGEGWIAEAEADGLERSTVGQYRQHLDLHIRPMLGSAKLSRLTKPMVKKFRQDLRKRGRSAAMVDKILTSLGSIV